MRAMLSWFSHPLVLYPVCINSVRARQLQHLIKLRTKGEEVLSTRLKHAEDDCKRAIERAERAETQIRSLEQGAH
jgi:hypothetical protein